MKASDLVANPPPPGFKKLEPINGVKAKPPRIRWGIQFEGWKQGRQIRYLKELSCSMNHAADLLQNERNELNRILLAKEKLILSLQSKLKEQGEFLQAEVVEWNKEKQVLLQEAMDLQKKVKDLENGSKH